MIRISWDLGSISKVTVNGSNVSRDWTGIVKSGDTIVAYGSQGNNNWYYYVSHDSGGSGSRFGFGNICTGVVPSSCTSGYGSLVFGNNYGQIHYVYRDGVCASWTFSAT